MNEFKVLADRTHADGDPASVKLIWLVTTAASVPQYFPSMDEARQYKRTYGGEYVAESQVDPDYVAAVKKMILAGREATQKARNV